MNSTYKFKSITVCRHHVKKNICGSRARYRDGRKETAVKVYTVNQESVYLLITNVPAVGGAEELRSYCDQYGIVDDFRPLDDYPTEDFTEAYLVRYSTFSSARSAKKRLDDKSFLGSTLHVCYAPEFETVSETRLKLQDRRKFIAWKTNSGKKAQVTSCSLSSLSQQNSNSHLNNSNTSSSSKCEQPVTYVWAGKEYTMYPSLPEAGINSQKKPKTSGMFVPRQCKPSMGQNFSKLATTASSSGLQKDSTLVNDSSYQNTISQVRTKISGVSVPNVRVSLKRRKRL